MSVQAKKTYRQTKTTLETKKTRCVLQKFPQSITFPPLKNVKKALFYPCFSFLSFFDEIDENQPKFSAESRQKKFGEDFTHL